MYGDTHCTRTHKLYSRCHMCYSHKRVFEDFTVPGMRKLRVSCRTYHDLFCSCIEIWVIEDGKMSSLFQIRVYQISWIKYSPYASVRLCKTKSLMKSSKETERLHSMFLGSFEQERN